MAEPFEQPPVAADSEEATCFADQPPPVSGFWVGGKPPSLPCRLGRYELLREAGSGGMGAVYLAHDAQLNRRVAVKIPLFSGPRPEAMRERFFREARAAATVSHPNICPIFDVGEEGVVPFLIMAYVEGLPLSSQVSPGRPFPESAAVELVRSVALAMAEAHRAGVVHRDLKPSNIMISRQGQPVVTDFGLACLGEGIDGRLTDYGTTMGTPAYMPPEQINGELALIGPASDVYSLGVILYELLTGRPPFEGKRGELIAATLYTAPVPPSNRRPALSPALDGVCLRALQKQPGDRYPTMQAFAEALGAFLSPGHLPRPPLPPAADPSPAAETVRLSGSGHRPPRPLGRWFVGGTLALAALGVLAAMTLFDPPGPGEARIVLSDPDARVEVLVDGTPLPGGGRAGPVSLPAGGHRLEVRGPDVEPVNQPFTVRPGETEVLAVAVQLRRGARPAAPAPKAPARALPRDVPGLLAAVHYFEQEGRWDEAAEAAGLAISLDAKSADARLARARVRFKLRQTRPALEDAEAALRLESRNPAARCLRAACLLDLMDYKACVEECTRVIDDPAASVVAAEDALDIRSQAYGLTENLTRAAEDCGRALRLALPPRKPVYYMRRAALYDRLGDKAAAQSDRSAAYAIDQNIGGPPPPSRKD